MSEIWEVPIVDGPSGVQIGVFRMDAGGYDEPSWDGPEMAAVEARRPPGDQPRPYASGDHLASATSSHSGMPAALDHIPLPVNPSLYAKVKLLLETPVATV